MLKYAFVAVAFFPLIACTVYAEGQTVKALRWPGFLGPPAADMNADDLPLVWSPHKNIAWNADIPGYGQSSPVVWGDRIFVSSISGPMKETCHVSAFNIRTGEKLWQRDLPAASKVENTNYVSKAAPTPVVDDVGLIVWFEGGNLAAFTHEGEVRWIKNLVEEHGEISARHGLGSSLAQTTDAVFVWVERQDEPYLLAVEKASGATRWKVAGLNATSWSTPMLLPVGQTQHLVLSGSGKLVGYDPQTGRQLWSFDEISGNTVPTPQPVGNGTLLVGATVGRGEASGGRAAESNGMVRLNQDQAGAWEASFDWRCENATSSFGSPIAHQGFAYFVNQTGVLFCVDAENGRDVYSHRLGESVWATPLAVGDRIYFAGRSGTTTVVRAGPKFEKLAENRLWSDSQSQPESEQANRPPVGQDASESNPPVQYAIVAVPGRLLIRSGQTLFCIADLKE